MREEQIAPPLMFFGAVLMPYSLYGYPWLQRKVGAHPRGSGGRTRRDAWEEGARGREACTLPRNVAMATGPACASTLSLYFLPGRTARLQAGTLLLTRVGLVFSAATCLLLPLVADVRQASKAGALVRGR